MKYPIQLYLFLMWSICTASGFAQTPTLNFSFSSGVLIDGSGSDTFLTPTGTARTLIQDRAGNTDNALQINGDKLAIDAPLAQSISVSFYIKTTDNPTNGKMLIANRSNNYQDLGYMLTLRNGKLEFFAQMDVTIQFVNSGTYSVAPIGQNFSNIGAYTVNDGQWHHIVLVATSYQNPGNAGYSFQIYVDGNLDSQPQLAYTYQTSQETYQTHQIVSPNTSFEITPYVNAAYKYTDAIDDVKYYSEALNQTQVTALYNTAAECIVNIPDANFKAYLVGNNLINTNGDSEIQCTEAEVFNGSIVGQNLGISNITGIETFTSLTQLLISRNNISTLDLSNNTALQTLYCYNNQLTSLDISLNTSITSLYCYSNQLTSLNVANGNNTNFTSFDVSGVTFGSGGGNSSLTCIQVDDASWSATNWTEIPSGASFNEDCSTACIISIPDANLKAYLISASSIDINNDDEIQCSEAAAYRGPLYLNNSNIADLTGIEAFTAFTRLEANSNQLTSVDLSACVALQYVTLDENSLTSLDFSANTALTTIYVNNNGLVSLNVANGNNTNITTFQAYGNNNLTCIQVDDAVYSQNNWKAKKGNNNFTFDVFASFSEDCAVAACVVDIPDTFFKTYLVGNAAINTNGDTEIQCAEAESFKGTINCNSQGISDLTGIESFTGITNLQVNNNVLTALDLSANTALTTIRCDGNQLTSLNTGQNSVLSILWCYNNQFAGLDIGGNTGLTEVNCSNNLLTSLTLGANVALTSLQTQNNQLVILDVSGLTALTHFYCQNNALTSLNIANGNNANIAFFDAKSNASLTCVQVDDANYMASNWNASIDATTSYSEDCEGALNTAPVLTTIPNMSVVANEEQISYPIFDHASDADGDVLTYSLDATSISKGITITSNGILQWGPIAVNVGIHTITLTVSDGNGGTVSQSFTITVTAVAACDITNVDILSTDCEGTDTYSAQIVVYYSNAPDTGELQIEAGDQDFSFAITGSPQTITLTSLTVSSNSQGIPVNLYVYFSETECDYYLDQAWFAPGVDDCIVEQVCAISSVTVDDISACSNDTYTAEVTVSYSNAPTTGTLIVNGINFTVTSSPQSVSFNGTANGNSMDLNVSFSENTSCVYTEVGAWTAPVACSEDVLGVVDVKSFVSVYPNPVSRELHIAVDFIEATLYDMSGSIVKRWKGNTNRLNMSGIRADIYSLTIITREGKYSQKLIKE